VWEDFDFQGFVDLASSQGWRDQEGAYADDYDDADNKSNMSDINAKPLQTEGVQDTEGDISGIDASRRVKKGTTGFSNVFAQQMTITDNALLTQFNIVETYIVVEGKEVRVGGANKLNSNQDLSSKAIALLRTTVAQSSPGQNKTSNPTTATTVP
jgi:hypothetical protein